MKIMGESQMADDVEYECIYELREGAWHPLIQNYTGESYYEMGCAQRPRKPFNCDSCGSRMEVGMGPRHHIKSYGCDSGDWPTTNICQPCWEDPKVQEAVAEIRSGKYDA